MSKSSRLTVVNCSPAQHLSVLLRLCACYSLLIAASLPTSAQTQARRDLHKPLATSNTFAPAQLGAGAASLPLQTTFAAAAVAAATSASTGDTPLSSAATGSGFHSLLTSTLAPQQQQQQRTLKFTLIAGKYWKFNIKTNSLQTGHREKELRLHRNLSANNFIIDDDGWFQYNHQQQQLFAWPSYNVKPATYYFVLLPSGLDYEADGENAIKSGDIVANIVVELIEPYTTSKLDLDRLVDHKFSLEYLHRHASYPLLLTQIVSVFNILATRTTTQQGSQGSTTYSSATEAVPATTPTATTTITTTASPTTNSVLAALQQSKQARLSSRLGEFLLIDAPSSQDGEFFSLTWTTHPSLVNNAPILPINECRLNTINETISKLSSRSILYPSAGDKFVISYSLEGPLVNSQSIIPTERGNYALKLFLNSACRRRKIIEELGLISELGVFSGLGADVEDRENVIVDRRENSKANQVQTTTRSAVLATSTVPTVVSEPVRITATESTAPISTPGAPGETSSSGSGEIGTEATLKNERVLPILGSPQPAPEQARPPAPNKPPAGTHSYGQPPAIQVESTTTNARRALESSSTQAPSAPVIFKSQPQAKSFVNFLDPTDSQTITAVMAGEIDRSKLMSTTPPSSSIMSNTTTDPSGAIANISATTPAMSSIKSGQESSLNDDLIGILNETMDFLVSIAVPLAVVLGIILIASILIAICNLCMKRRKSKQFAVGDRFKFRYGSERKQFFKNSSKPVILEADQKSLSMGGTPMRKPRLDPNVEGESDKMLGDSKSSKKNKKLNPGGYSGGSDFFSMSVFATNNGHSSGAHASSADCATGDGGHSGACD